MEFSYRVSEAECLRAWKLQRKQTLHAKVLKAGLTPVLFWAFILVCLMLLWMIVQHSAPQPAVPPTQQTEPSAPSTGSALILNLGPFVVLLLIWVYAAFRFGPMRMRQLYRKDPTMQGQFTVNITTEAISMRNTVGSSSQSGWNLYEYWREGQDVIVLKFRSGAYFVLGLSSLSDLQRTELRGILSTALQKK